MHAPFSAFSVRYLAPMDFPGVVGQHELQKHLVDLSDNNRLGHAVMLTGRQGSGILPLAMAFGQFIVSQRSKTAAAPAPMFDLFGAAPEAAPANDGFQWDQQALRLQHPDLHFSYPVVKAEGRKMALSTDYAAEWRQFYAEQPYGSLYDWLQFIRAENKQGNISADECTEIIKKLNLKSFKGGYKVLVMWMPELLGTAGNKLLKLVEEPPEDTLFIFATENEQDVLGTIVSRCQIIRVPPIEQQDMVVALAEKTGSSVEEMLTIARMANGSYSEALYLLQHADHNWNSVLRDWLNAALARGSQARNSFAMQNKFVSEISGIGREKQKQLLRYFLEIIEIAVRLRMMPQADLPMPADELDFAQKLNSIAGVAQQKAIAEEIEQSIYHIERNANPKLLFHALTLKFRSIVLDKQRIELH